MTTAMTTVSQLNTLEGQRAHYNAIRQRLGLRVYTPVVPLVRIPPPPPPPEPVVRECRHARRRRERREREIKLLSMMEDLAKRPSSATKYNRLLIEVADKHNLPYSFVASRSRLEQITKARGEFYYLLRKAKIGYSQIARQIGRDHTTIIHGVKAHCARTGLPYPV